MWQIHAGRIVQQERYTVKRLLLAAMLPMLLLAACSDDDNTTQPPAGDTQKPSISFVTPVNDQGVTGDELVVELTASDNVGVTKVEIFVDTAPSPAAVLQAAPWKTTIAISDWTVGTHAIAAKAYDAAGNASNRIVVSVVKTQPGVFAFSFTNGKTFTYDTWDIDENNEKVLSTKSSIVSKVEQGDGTAIGGRTDWWRLIDTEASGAKDTVIARVDGNGNLEIYGYTRDYIRRFVEGMIEGGFPMEMPTLPDAEWSVMAYCNSAPGVPANPGTEWNITAPGGFDIPVGLFSANVKIKGQFIDRTETVSVQGKTIKLWHVKLINTVTIFGAESNIVVHLWYSDDPSGRIQLWQESTLLNLVLTNFQLNGEKWELASWN